MEAADKLADSLDKGLASLNRLLKEENVSFWRKLWGDAGTGDIRDEFGGDTGHEGFIGRINELTDAGNAKIRAATDTKKRDAAQTELSTKLLKEYGDEIGKVAGMISDAQRLQQEHDHPKYNPAVGGGDPTMAAAALPYTPPADQRTRLATLRGVLRQLNAEADSVRLQGANAALTQTKNALTTAAENAALDRPFEDRMKALGVQLEGIKARLAAIGQPESVQTAAKAFAEAQKIIEEVNRALEKHHTQLTDAQKAQIGQKEQEIASSEAEATWREKLASTTSAIGERIHSQELLTAAIGRGYEATKQANVETQLMSTLGQHYSDSEWMKAHAGEVSGLRSRLGNEYDAKYGQQVASAIDKLGKQIELERDLAAVQEQGAEAVRQAELAHRLKQIAEDNDTESAKRLIQREIELYNATRANATAAEVAKINEKITATERLTAAVFEGAEAQRKAALEVKYAEMDRQDVTGKTSAAQRKLDEAEHQHQITVEAAKTVTAYGDELQRLNDIEVALQKQKKDHGDTLELEIALRDIENERLRLAVQHELRLKGVKDGFKAFFLEMQEDAKHASEIIYQALTSALDRTSDQMANLLTGKKTEFGKMFEDIGHEMVKSSVKSMMQEGLGKLGEKFGIHSDKKPKGTETDPIYVVLTDKDKVKQAKDALSGLGGFGKIGNVFKSALGGVGRFFGKLFGGGSGGDGLTEDVSSTFTPMAEGGDVYPGNAYKVAEAGEFEVFQPKGPGTITPAHKLGGDHYEYHIDARGADLGVEARLEAAMERVHTSAVQNAVRVNAERAKRTPERSSI